MYKRKKIGVVITTIANGFFLDKFIPSVAHAMDQHDIIFYIIGDINTPEKCKIRCRLINSEHFPCLYLTVEDQEAFLRSVGFPVEKIPYRSDNRRNVGYLKAYQDCCDIIISMDDDNFPVDKDFFLQHAITGEVMTLPAVFTANNWYNPICLLRSKSATQQEIDLYPRGYPYIKRWKDKSLPIADEVKISGKIGINVGLWVGDPDVDALTRLTLGCYTEADLQQNNITRALKPQYLMPINSQNTSMVRDAIASYYFIKMGAIIQGMKIDRFGDIFSGYFLLLCNRSVGNITTLYHPLVSQERNEHILLKDLHVELPGILIIEELVTFLEEGLPKTNSYSEAYAVLAEKLIKFAGDRKTELFWNNETLTFIKETTSLMRTWITTIANIDSQQSKIS